MTKVRWMIAVAGMAALLAGCGDDDNDSSSKTATDSNAVAPITENPTGEATTSVGMKDIKFIPDKIVVQVGDTVTWTNNETVEHDVKAEKGADFASDVFGEGKTFSYKTTEPGTIEYVCTLHPGMDGTITVTE